MTTNWSSVPEVAHEGESGAAFSRTLEVGNIRVRMVRYTPGYVANHWCDRGHVLLVLSGALETELRDGPRHQLGSGMSYQVASRVAPHRSRTATGATLFIVD
ncbi:MAG TPA: DHCW motif cupin fold protein [Gemmatimonadales bacterium]|nr:DHCW motif cupin fold protein [Gemmatimonadales bacterium]